MNTLAERETLAKPTTVSVREVTTKRERRLFVDFPNKLYRDAENYIPAMYGDDLADWDPKKNPAFDYCEAKCFLAYRDGKIVGRIGAILSHKANEKWNTRRMRFSQVDFIDDDEVSTALFAAVEDWAREKGCTQVHGPLGFCDLDREGMLVEGFDRRSMFITYYNHPYYNDHLARRGYRKDVDWMEYLIHAPEKGSDQERLLRRLAQRVLDRQHYHTAVLKNRREYAPYIEKVFRLLNEAYAPLYGVVPLTDRQIVRYTKKFLPLISPDCACFVLDENEELVAFGVAAPSMAPALKKSRGRLFPFGWIGVLKALHRNDTLDMFLIAVRPELQGKALNAVVLDYLLQRSFKNGIRFAETGPQLETNSKILAQWKMFEKEQHKRRRCYIKDIE